MKAPPPNSTMPHRITKKAFHRSLRRVWSERAIGRGTEDHPAPAVPGRQGPPVAHLPVVVDEHAPAHHEEQGADERNHGPSKCVEPRHLGHSYHRARYANASTASVRSQITVSAPAASNAARSSGPVVTPTVATPDRGATGGDVGDRVAHVHVRIHAPQRMGLLDPEAPSGDVVAHRARPSPGTRELPPLISRSPL